MSHNTEPDPTDDPAYQVFLNECAKHCRCAVGICGGVLAGGLCDELNFKNDNWREDREDE